MCDISNGFKLCTCKGRPKKSEPHWVLERQDTNIITRCEIMGMPIFPEYTQEEESQINLIVKQLNQGNCFDFAYQPTEGDVFTMHFPPDNDYRFRYQSGIWEQDDSTAFDGWREQMVRKKKGKITVLEK